MWVRRTCMFECSIMLSLSLKRCPICMQNSFSHNARLAQWLFQQLHDSVLELKLPTPASAYGSQGRAVTLHLHLLPREDHHHDIWVPSGLVNLILEVCDSESTRVAALNVYQKENAYYLERVFIFVFLGGLRGLLGFLCLSAFKFCLTDTRRE